MTSIPAVPVDVVFDIGAGDSFHAGFLAVWRPGGDPARRGSLRRHAAALKISREPLPELLPTRDEVVAAMETTGARGSDHRLDLAEIMNPLSRDDACSCLAQGLHEP